MQDTTELLSQTTSECKKRWTLRTFSH